MGWFMGWGGVGFYCFGNVGRESMQFSVYDSVEILSYLDGCYANVVVDERVDFVFRGYLVVR